MMRQNLQSRSNRVKIDLIAMVQTMSVATKNMKLKIINVYVPSRSTGLISTYVQAANTIRRLKLQLRHLSVRKCFYSRIEKEIQGKHREG